MAVSLVYPKVSCFGTSDFPWFNGGVELLVPSLPSPSALDTEKLPCCRMVCRCGNLTAVGIMVFSDAKIKGIMVVHSRN